MTVVYLLAALLLLGILITAHEFGHFLFARLGGIAVKEFAVGMGPVLLSRTGKTGTRYSLRAIPLGGFCAFYGEDDLTGEGQNDPRAYNKQSVWRRMLSVLMGPGMNFLLAFVVAVGFFAVGGIPEVSGWRVTVVEVAGTGPAYEAGLKNGDELLSINGVTTDETGSTALLNTITDWKTGDAPLHLIFLRGGEKCEADLTPFWDEDLARYRIGVTMGTQAQTVNKPVSFGEALRYGADSCWYAGTAILGALKDLVTTGEGIEDTAGPVGVISLVSSEVRDYGLEGFINLLIIISINLGIMNLLPIPGLDGSRLIFMLIEAIRGKPVAPQKEAVVHLIGYVFLLMLMLVLTFKDVFQLFG